MGLLHDRPICFWCDKPIEDNNFVFAAACDHDTCPSAVWHPLCLMDWRQHRDEALARRKQWFENHRVQVEIQIARRDGGEPEDPPPGVLPGE